MTAAIAPPSSPLFTLHHSRYEAFGAKTGATGDVANKYLFTGEQYDQNLGDYYLRARYYNADTGRFTRRDSYEGNLGNPLTLHKYIYANANPVGNIDPSGYFSILETTAILTIITGLISIGSQTYVNAGSFFSDQENSKDDVILYVGYSPNFTAGPTPFAVGHAALQIDNQIYDYPRAIVNGVDRNNFLKSEQDDFHYFYHRYSINYSDSQKAQLKANINASLTTGDYSQNAYKTKYDPFFHNCVTFVTSVLPSKPNNDWLFDPFVKPNFAPIGLDVDLTTVSALSRGKTVKRLNDGMLYPDPINRGAA